MPKTQLDPQLAISKVDPVWAHVRQEAEDIVRREPELATFIYSAVLHHERLEDSIVHRVAERLDHPELSGDMIRKAYQDALRDEPDLGNAMHDRVLEPLMVQHGGVDEGGQLRLAPDDFFGFLPDMRPDRVELAQSGLRIEQGFWHGVVPAFDEVNHTT